MNARAAFVFAVLGWAVALAVFLLPFVSPDVFWHLSAAKFMVATRSWPKVDWLSFTMRGRPWVDFEWACQLAWYATLHLFGWWGLVLLKAGVFTAAAALLWRSLALYELSLEAKTVALLAWAVAWIPLNDLRPENFSVLFFTAEWGFLEARRLGKRTPFPAWGLFVLYAAWANFHAGFVYGLVLLGLYGAAELRRERSLVLAAWTGACALATLANPYGWAVHRVLWEHARDMAVIQTYITEWQQPYIFNAWLAPFWAVLLAAFVAVFARLLQDRKVPAEHWLALAFFAISGGYHARLVVYAVMVAVPVAACHLAKVRWATRPGVRTPATVVCAAALAAFFIVRMGPTLALAQPFIPRYVPDETIRFLQKELPALKGRRMYNPWQWGGYLGYKLHPDLPVFVDGRYLFHSLIGPMIDSKESPETYRAFLDRYGIELVVLRAERQQLELPLGLPGGRTVRLSRPVLTAFLPRRDWALVYWSRQGLVYARRKSFPKDWLDANEYRLLIPDDRPATELLIKSGAMPWTRLSAEFERFGRWCPEIAAEPWMRAWVESLRKPKR